MATDMKRLQDVRSGKLRGRGCGKTYSMLHELCGQIQANGVKDVLIVSRYANPYQFMQPMLSALLTEFGLSATWQHSRQTVRVGNVTIRFVTKPNAWGQSFGRDLTTVYDPS